MRYIFVILGLAAIVVIIFWKHWNPDRLLFESGDTQNTLEESPGPSSFLEFTRQATLKAVGKDDLSIGVATQKLIGEEFIILVNVQLNPPAEDTFYFAWLVKRKPNTEFVPIGRLSKSSEKSNMWQTAFRSFQPFLDYDEIWISLNKKEKDRPEKIILKGKWEK
jgi:hypothetical protein